MHRLPPTSLVIHVLPTTTPTALSFLLASTTQPRGPISAKLARSASRLALELFRKFLPCKFLACQMSHSSQTGKAVQPCVYVVHANTKILTRINIIYAWCRTLKPAVPLMTTGAIRGSSGGWLRVPARSAYFNNCTYYYTLLSCLFIISYLMAVISIITILTVMVTVMLVHYIYSLLLWLLLQVCSFLL